MEMYDPKCQKLFLEQPTLLVKEHEVIEDGFPSLLEWRGDLNPH
jgi:hypothetical protein